MAALHRGRADIAPTVETLMVDRKQKAQPLGQVRVRQDRLQSWLADKGVIEKKGMSIDAAARKLGVKQKVAYCLVRQGLLGSMDGESLVGVS
jgi:hypothetical protein